MTSWKPYKLGDVVNILDNRRIPLSAREREQRHGEYPYYGAQGIIDYVDDYLFDGTYLLIAEDGENLRSKKQNIAQLVSGKYWVNNHAHILESNGLCDIRYICYLLNIIDISGYITGSAQPKLNQANLLAISISLPPLEEQRRIAGILGAIDDKIENNRRINANFELQAQALYKQWFVDFEFPNEEGKPYKSSGGKMVDSELGPIPEGWRVQTISDISVRIASGGTPKSLNESYYNGEIKWFTTKELKDCFLIDSDKHISTEALNDSAAKLFPKNTILMAIYAAPTVGRLGILTAESTFNQAAVGIVAKEEIGHLFVYLTLLAERENLNNLASGAAQQNLNVGIVKQYKLIVPTKKLLIEFNQIAGSLFERIKVVSNENKTLATLRDTLLPKLMNGEIKL